MSNFNISVPAGEYIAVPALCLDLDGTVRYSRSGKFITSLDDIALYDGVEKQLWQYRHDGFLIFGLTNQGAIAQGYKTPADEALEIERMSALFDNDPFHHIQSCYHMEKGKVFPYNYRSLCRKPDIGMLVLLEKAAFDQGIVIDWNKSLLVGDLESDKQCAEKARIQFEWAWQFFGRSEPQ